MNEEDIRKILPDWALSYVLEESEGKKLYAAEKQSGNKVSYASVEVLSIPKNAEKLRKKFPSDEDYKKEVASLVEKKKEELRFLRSLSGKTGLIDLKESYDVCTGDGEGYFIIARYGYVEPLLSYIKTNGLTVGGAIKLGIDICKGLESLKKLGYIHGDVSVENIYADSKGRFRLGGIDVDLINGKKYKKAKKYESMRFAPKESCSEKTRNSRCDTYSLGLTLYYLLNDQRLPFEEENGIETAVKMRLSGSEIPAPAFKAGKLNDIVMKSCSPVRDERYKSPRSMREDLEKAYEELKNQIEEEQRKKEAESFMTCESGSEQAAGEKEPAEKEKRGGNYLAVKITAALLSFVSVIAAGVFGFCIKTGYSFSRDISKHGIKISSEYDLTYDKSQKTPKIIITGLNEGEDYTAEYKNNTEIGSASVIVKGSGKYTGEKEINFEITPKKCLNFYAPLVTTDSVSLKWDAVEGADRYFIYRHKSGKDWKKIDTVFGSTECVINDLTPGKKYKFRVRAAAEINGEIFSGVSTSLSVTMGS